MEGEDGAEEDSEQGACRNAKGDIGKDVPDKRSDGQPDGKQDAHVAAEPREERQPGGYGFPPLREP